MFNVRYFLLYEIVSAGEITRIPSVKLFRSNEANVNLNGLCGGREAHELFLADNTNEVVRSFDVRGGGLDVRDAFRPARGEYVNDVAYIAESDSLYVATRDSDNSNFSVRLLTRTDGQWIELHQKRFKQEGDKHIFLRVLSGGILFCGKGETNVIHVCSVLEDRFIQDSCPLPLPYKHEGFDAQLSGNERRLAIAFQEGDGAVALYSVKTKGADPLSVFPLSGAQLPLFCGDKLLVKVYNEPVVFSTKDGSLHRERQLIARDEGLDIFCWCYVDGTIYVWDFKSKDILVYN